MNSRIDYPQIISKYIIRVKNLREVRAPMKGLDESIRAASAENAYFEIANDRYYNYQFLLEEINKISTELLTEVMTTLITAYKITSLKIIKDAPILSLILFDKDEITLFYFKRFGRLKPKDNAFVRMILSKQQISQIKFVSLVRKNAAAYSFNHAYDNIELSLHDFFLKFFNEDEFVAFERMEEEFSDNAKKCIGHSVIKTLAPNTLYSFKRHLISFIQSHSFASMIDDRNICGEIDSISSEIIKRQFYDEAHYKALIGSSLFSESIITAEWMYDSMMSVNQVDLTVVALGFFKALEQMLYDYIKMHRGEDKRIKRVYSNPELDGKPPKIYLNDNSIRKKWINTMLDSLITFLEDYPELFNEGISCEARRQIIESLNDVKKKRNGFFHKDNIEDFKVVQEVRESTYVAMYYLLGGLKFRKQEKKIFKIPIIQKPDSEVLKEYMAYHDKSIYYIGEEEILKYAAISKMNDEITYNQNGEISIGKCVVDEVVGFDMERFVLPVDSFKDAEPLKHKRHILDLSNSNLVIMEGEMTVVPEGVHFSGPVRTIYKNNQFVVTGRDVVTEY